MDRYELKKEEIKAKNKYREENFCKCLNTELRKRILKNGAIQYVYQCLNCGNTTSNAISKIKAEELNGSSAFICFDDNLSILWKKKFEKGIDSITKKYESLISEAIKLNEQKDDKFFENYKKYLESEKWNKKRLKVIERANYICEGCRENEATEVHHLNYEHVFDELLFELVALCKSCHTFIHKKDEEIIELEIEYK